MDPQGAFLVLDARTVPVPGAPLGQPSSHGSVFALGGLELEEFEPCTPLPPIVAQADTHFAWESSRSGLRVELAEREGRVVGFEVLEPVTDEADRSVVADRALFMNWLILAALFAVTAPAGVHYPKSGRADPVVSLRMADVAGFMLLLAWLLAADYPGSGYDAFVFSVEGFCFCMSAGMLIWLLSMAIEPRVQLVWPRVFISWSRLFRWDWNAPGVRGDILTGAFLGILAALPIGWLSGNTADLACPGTLLRGLSWLGWASLMCEVLPGSILNAFSILGLLAVLGWMLRSKRWAVACTWVIVCLLVGGAEVPLGSSLLGVLFVSLVVFSLVHDGLLAAVALKISYGLLTDVPFAPDLGSWYSVRASPRRGCSWCSSHGRLGRWCASVGSRAGIRRVGLPWRTESTRFTRPNVSATVCSTWVGRGRGWPRHGACGRRFTGPSAGTRLVCGAGSNSPAAAGRPSRSVPGRTA